ncbi:hypothetical protein ACP70R_008144 [Stipagrostis hirtigluma subsp. patula]
MAGGGGAGPGGGSLPTWARLDIIQDQSDRPGGPLIQVLGPPRIANRPAALVVHRCGRRFNDLITDVATNVLAADRGTNVHKVEAVDLSSLTWASSR